MLNMYYDDASDEDDDERLYSQYSYIKKKT